MDLTVKSVRPVNVYYSAEKASPKQKEVLFSKNSDINLNNDPNAVAFKGIISSFFKKPAKQETAPVPEARIYGPHKVTASEAYSNDKDAAFLVNTIAGYINVKNHKPYDTENYVQDRATNKFIKSMQEPFFALLCYYPKTETSFPKFYDFIARAVPAAFSKIDEKSSNDNTTRLYEETIKNIEKYGENFEPGTTDAFESGIKYLYIATDFPLFKLDEKEYKTEETLDAFEQGKMPKFDRGRYKYPRIHQSVIPDESYYYIHTTKPGNHNKYAAKYNKKSCSVNKNYERKEKPIPAPETSNFFNPWWDQDFDIIEPMC